MSKADEHYLEARDAVLGAIRDLGKKARFFRTPDGTAFRVHRKMPLRIYLMGLDRRGKDEREWTSFLFQRNGRVNLSGSRKVPFREALAAGHEPWASRTELLDLAGELRHAEPSR
jgi:hypothetical protein